MTPWCRTLSTRSARLVLPLIAAWIAGVGSSPAVSPVQWSQQSLADFEKGKPEGVSVSSRGGIVLSRATREIRVPPLEEQSQPFLWSEAIDSKGNLYVGSGNEGRVFRVPKSGSGSLFYSTGDLAVHALAVDSRDNLYVGTSPDGKVYRVPPDGKGEVWFDPEDRYIWALAVDRSGAIYAATGEKGIIYKVTARGVGTPFFDSEESHIVSLAFDRQGNLLAGSSGKGLLYRISPAGKGEVLLDTPLKEVNALAVDGTGRIYLAALLSDAGIPPRAPERIPARSTGEAVIIVTAPAEGPPLDQAGGEEPVFGGEAVMASLVPERPIRSQVLRIETDGTATSLWRSLSETVFSLALTGDQSLFLGTGDTGKIRRIEPDGSSSLAAKVGSSQVTALLSSPDGTLYAAGSNAGKIYVLETDPSDTGTYVSPPRDASAMAKWGRIGWTGDAPAGTRVELFTRSGNSAVPDSTWSDWSQAYVNPAGNGVVSPSARFIQWKARLARQAKGVSPLLESVSLTYLPANLAPRVEDPRVNPPGIIIQKPPLSPEMEGLETAFSERPSAPEGSEFPSPFPTQPGKRVFQRGMRSLSWTASDPNQDTLRFDLLFLGDGEREWKPLARGLKEGYFAFDSTLLPDGRYRVKIRATDALSNPPGTEKSGEEISPPFVVDNTPPRVEASARKDEKGMSVEARVTDSTSPIRSLEYSLDARRWVLVMPADGIADATSEQFRIPLDKLDSGEHTLLLKATDAEGNVGAEKVVLGGG